MKECCLTCQRYESVCKSGYNHTPSLMKCSCYKQKEEITYKKAFCEDCLHYRKIENEHEHFFCFQYEKAYHNDSNTLCGYFRTETQDLYIKENKNEHN